MVVNGQLHVYCGELEVVRQGSNDSGKNLSLFHCVHHKSYMDCPGFEPKPLIVE